MGIVDYKFEKTGDAARKAAEGVDQLNEAAASAAGSSGGRTRTRSPGKPPAPGGGGFGGGQGILQFAFMLDDMQYGLRGVLNNIPPVLTGLGVGAGLTGVISIATIAVSQLIERKKEWFSTNETGTKSLKELSDEISEETAAIEKQKKAIEDLGKQNSDRIEDLVKLRNLTDDLKTAEAQLETDRKNRKAVEDAAKNVGTAAEEEFAKQKDAIKSTITDAGRQAEVLQGITTAVDQQTPGIDDGKVYAEAAEMARNAVGPNVWEQLQQPARDNLTRQYVQRVRANKQFARDREIRGRVDGIFGGLFNPANQKELDEAFGQLRGVMPGVANEIAGVRQFDRENEEAERGNERWRQGGRGVRRRREDGMSAAEAEQARLDGVVDEATRFFGDRNKAARNAADRQASARETAINRAMMNPEGWQQQVMQARNAAIEQGRNPREVAALNERNQAAVANKMAEGFEKAGFTREQAAEASVRVMGSVTESIQRMVRTGQMSLDAYGRLTVTVNNLQQQINAQAAEWQNRQWAAGMRP